MTNTYSSLTVNITEENSNNKIAVNELDREFIFLFAIATLARYRVNEWTSIMSGEDSDLISKIFTVNRIIFSEYNSQYIVWTTIAFHTIYNGRKVMYAHFH